MGVRRLDAPRERRGGHPAGYFPGSEYACYGGEGRENRARRRLRRLAYDSPAGLAGRQFLGRYDDRLAPRRFAVKRGDVLAGMRVIPLVISKTKMEAAKEAAGTEPLFNVLPFTAKTAGVVTTGSEVFKGRIADTFTPVIEDKLAEYGIAVTQHVTLADDPAAITAAIQDMLAQSVDMVFCTGGMSVDPDDQTPLAIKNTGARIVSYGAPVLPGAMFLLAYTGDGRPVAACRAASCTASGRFLIWFCRRWLPAWKSKPTSWRASAKAGCA